MRTPKSKIGKARFLAILIGQAVLLLAIAPSASAAATWKAAPLAASSAEPGGQLEYHVQLRNVGNDPAIGSGGDPIVFTAKMPAGITAHDVAFRIPAQFEPFLGKSPVDWSALSGFFGFHCSGDGPGVEGAGEVTCSFPIDIPKRDLSWFLGPLEPILTADVDPGAVGEATAEFGVSGAGGAPAETVEVTRITDEPVAFGVDSFDEQIAADPSGTPFTAAGGHPFSFTTFIDFNTGRSSNPALGEPWPISSPRDVVAQLPPGFVGAADSVSHCTNAQIAGKPATSFAPECPPESQIGTVSVRLNAVGANNGFGPISLFSMVPPSGSPARFGFTVQGTVVTLLARLRSEGDYGLTVEAPEASEGLAITGIDTTIWGVPADEVNRPSRACPEFVAPQEIGVANQPTCVSNAPKHPFLRMPTSCTSPGHGLPFSVTMDSWRQPGARLPGGAPDLSDPAWDSRAVETHAGRGYPWARSDWGPPVGVDACDAVPFDPHLEVTPTTDAADSPSGLNVELSVPQECWEHPEQICDSDLRRAAIRLPEGMTINPSAAGGQEACSAQQIGLTTPLGQAPSHFATTPQSCPNASKIGTVELTTPLIDHTLSGAVYLAKQEDNPFQALLAMYLVIEDPETGTIVKLPGRVLTDEQTGRLETVFDDNPQLPFEHLGVRLFGGPRAALRTPPRCGTYAAESTFTPWSGNPPVRLAPAFEITRGPDGGCPIRGFDPQLSAGTQNPLAGGLSPFSLRITRADGTEELGGINVSLPAGISGYLKGIPYCSDTGLAGVSGDLGTGIGQERQPACPAASRVGTAIVGAGAGVSPFYTSSGRAYLAGPYKGAPLSIAVVFPAVAGPFDLGSVMVRNAIHVDPSTAQLTIESDPLPRILHGIPLDLRDVRVNIDRDHFTLNPTSCEPKQIGAKIVSTQGQSIQRSQHFQVAGCDRLGFKPKLSLQFKGATHRAAHPALRAVLRARSGDANIASATVLLPKTEQLENAHIRTVCTRVQYAAEGGGGAGCPRGSNYGYARAWTPLLDEPLAGPVYLRSNGGERELPDLVASLDGQIHVDLVGYIDSVRRRIRNRFAIVPDTPVNKFELRMQGGKKGLLANNTELCRAKPHADALFTAQNGSLVQLQPSIAIRCGGKGGKGRSGR